MALDWAGKGTAGYVTHRPGWGAQKPHVGNFSAQRQNASQYKGCCLGRVRFQVFEMP